MKVLRCIYKKIAPGDLRKFSATSNDKQSGGGARDLRFSPADRFFPEFKRMFPTENQEGNLSGLFYWEDHEATSVVISKPTKARPTEIRISNINVCFPDSHVPGSADDCILLLIEEEGGKVYPYFTSEVSLESKKWNSSFAKPIIDGLNAQRSKNTSPMGFVDLEYPEEFTNEREKKDS